MFVLIRCHCTYVLWKHSYIFLHQIVMNCSFFLLLVLATAPVTTETLSAERSTLRILYRLGVGIGIGKKSLMPGD